MSRKIKILEEYKPELLSALEDTDMVKFWKELRKHDVISYDEYRDFSALDHDHLDSMLKARYLLQVVFSNLQKYESVHVYDNFMTVLTKFKKMADLGYYLEQEITSKETANLECHGNVSSSTAAGAECPRRDNRFVLREDHIPKLLQILADCSHKWEEIGIALDLPPNAIAECRKATSNEIRLYNVLIIWYQNNKVAYLKTIKDALENPIVAMSSKSRDLEERFKEMIIPMMAAQKRPHLDSYIGTQSVDTEVTDGKSTLLGVQVQQGESISYQWMKNGQMLHNDYIYSRVDTDILFIKHARQGIEGAYSCCIKVSNNETTTKKVQLTVKYLPEKKALLNIYYSLKEVPTDLWPPLGSSTFISLALVHNEGKIKKEYGFSVRGDIDDIMKEKNMVKYEHLFAKYEKGALILVEGRPGSGKTTLTHKLTRDWATRPDVLNGAKLVFLVSLRVLCLFKENITLSSILELFYVDQTKVKEMLGESGEGVCFIIDGLDEYPERNVATNIIKRLVCKKYLPSAMVIVASRPIGIVELRHSARISKRIEVLGFSKDQILNYVKEYFNSGNDAQELQNYLRSHINIFHMCYLPVHAAMICFIYSRPGATVPNTETKVYEYFTLLTIKRKQKRDEDEKEYSTLKGLDGNIRESFKKVCQLAFDMTVKSKQTTDTSESGVCLSDDGSDIHSLGLVTIDAAAKLFGFKDFYSFLHLTFQEFLAAVYITELKEIEQLLIFNDHIHKKEMLMVWKFFCGLNMFTDPQDSKLQKIMTSELINDLYKSQCAFESQQLTVCDAIFAQNRTRVMTFKDHIFLPTEFKAIAYVISAVSVPVTEMVFDNCTLDQSGVTAFIEEASDKLIHIKSLSFSIQNDTEQFKVLNLLLKHLQFLKVLDLRNTELEKSEITSLTDNITLPSLDILKICMPLKKLSWRQYDPVNVLKTLSFNSGVLKQVQYIYCESDHETHKQSLIHLLKSFKCIIVPLCDIKVTLLSNIDVDLSMVPSFLQLSRLILVNCSLDDSQLENLLNTELDKSLETLRLDFNKITCKGAATVSQLIGKCTKLAQLSLSCNQIGDQGAIALSGALVHVPYLLELDLEGNTLGDEGAIALARATKNFSAEFQLLLWNISITPAGTNRILEYRPTANVKEANRPVESWKFVIVYSPQVISRAMQCCAHLKTLNLSGRRIGSPGTKKLADGLHHCNKLENLNLSNCRIGKDGVIALSEQVQYCQELKTLNLSSNKINCDHVYQLTRGLKSCSNLRELDLCQNNIGYDGIEALAYELKDCVLEKLRLNQNKIGRYGAASLARWLRSGVGLWRFEANAGDIISKDLLLENFLSKKLNNHFRRHRLDGEEENMTGHMWCSSLLELDLGNNKICSEGAAALGYGLKCCSNIQYLNLVENTIREDGAEVLAYGLKNCVTLRTLKLDKNRIGYSGAAVISTALSSCNNLQVLSITESDISPEGARILLSGLKTCSNLKILRFGSNSIGSDGAKALFEGLQAWKHLQELNIGNSGIDSDGATELMDGLKNSCSLQELHLHDNNISTNSLRALSESLKYTQLQYLNLSNIGSRTIDDIATLTDGLKHCTKLQTLDLSSNELGSPGIELLAKGLKLFKHLQFLNLSDNNIKSDGAKSLAEGLQCCTILQNLVLNVNAIGSAGATALFAGLKGCSRLENLHLRQNYIGSEGAKAVANWIGFICPSSSKIDARKHCCNIQALYLGHNYIGVEGTIAIARALKYCTKLQTLGLANNDIGPDGVVQLAEGLKNCVSLTFLDLDSNKIGTAGMISLCEGLKYCKAIKILHLGNNEIDSNGASALAEKLKGCYTLNKLYLDKNMIHNISELATKLKFCNIYTIHSLTNPAVRW